MNCRSLLVRRLVGISMDKNKVIVSKVFNTNAMKFHSVDDYHVYTKCGFYDTIDCICS